MFVTVILVRCFSALFFSLYMYTYTYTYRCNNCILYFLVLTKPVPAQNRHRPEFRLKRLLVPVTQNLDTLQTPVHEPVYKVGLLRSPLSSQQGRLPDIEAGMSAHPRIHAFFLSPTHDHNHISHANLLICSDLTVTQTSRCTHTHT